MSHTGRMTDVCADQSESSASSARPIETLLYFGRAMSCLWNENKIKKLGIVVYAKANIVSDILWKMAACLNSIIAFVGFLISIDGANEKIIVQFILLNERCLGVSSYATPYIKKLHFPAWPQCDLLGQ